MSVRGLRLMAIGRVGVWLVIMLIGGGGAGVGGDGRC